MESRRRAGFGRPASAKVSIGMPDCWACHAARDDAALVLLAVRDQRHSRHQAGGQRGDGLAHGGFDVGGAAVLAGGVAQDPGEALRSAPACGWSGRTELTRSPWRPCAAASTAPAARRGPDPSAKCWSEVSTRTATATRVSFTLRRGSASASRIASRRNGLEASARRRRVRPHSQAAQASGSHAMANTQARSKVMLPSFACKKPGRTHFSPSVPGPIPTGVVGGKLLTMPSFGERAKKRSGASRTQAEEAAASEQQPVHQQSQAAEHGQPRPEILRRRFQLRCSGNSAADVGRWTPHRFRNVGKRQRVDRFAVAGEHADRARRSREKLQVAAGKREGKRALVLIQHADGGASASLPTGTLTVPTVPACTSRLRNASGAIQLQDVGDQQRRGELIFHRGDGRDGSRAQPALLRLDFASHDQGPAADSATTISPGAGAKTSADSRVTSCVRRPAPRGVSAFHFSRRTPAWFRERESVSRSAGGSIQMESACGSAAERSDPAPPHPP